MVGYAKDKRLKIMHLYRRDALAAICSVVLAESRKVWNTNNEADLVKSTVRVNPHNVLKSVDRLVTMQKAVQGWICKQPALTIEYEDILENGRLNSELAVKMAAFLDVSADWDILPGLKKVSPPMEKYVENFSEVKDCFQGTKFENMVEASNNEVN